MYTIRLPFFLRLPVKYLTWRLPQKEETVYLTFDDGPIPEVTPWVLEQLKEADIKATFFCIADNVRKYPDIYQQIIEEGHSIGQHTYNHLPAFKTPEKVYLDNIAKAETLIASKLFRPPHGQIFFSQIFSLRKRYRIVLWDVLSGDFDQSISPDRCYRNVKKNIRNGSIVVFHDSLKAEKNLRYALPKIIEDIRRKGIQCRKLQQHGV